MAGHFPQWLAIFHTNIKEETTAKPAG